MEEYRIDHNPLAKKDWLLMERAKVEPRKLNGIEMRYVAEYCAIQLDEKSSRSECVHALAWFVQAHLYTLNTILKDNGKIRRYDNVAELAKEEAKRREHKKITYYGNIADTHKRLDTLENEIVDEQTPAQKMKPLFWFLLFGLGFLALALYCVRSDAAVNAVNWLLNAEFFNVVLVLLIMVLTVVFGCMQLGLLLSVLYVVVMWALRVFPGLTAFLVNGLLFLIAVILLLVAAAYLHDICTYKPLPEEEHRLNQERIAEKEALIRELNEYSDAMLARVDIMEKMRTREFSAFFNEMKGYLGKNFGPADVESTFSFLKKYYRKMRR